MHGSIARTWITGRVRNAVGGLPGKVDDGTDERARAGAPGGGRDAVFLAAALGGIDRVPTGSLDWVLDSDGDRGLFRTGDGALTESSSSLSGGSPSSAVFGKNMALRCACWSKKEGCCMRKPAFPPQYPQNGGRFGVSVAASIPAGPRIEENTVDQTGHWGQGEAWACPWPT